MSSTMKWLCITFSLVALAGCNNKTYDGAQRFPISGKVMVDGQPLDQGVIAFIPKGAREGAKELQGRPAGSPIRDGQYAVVEEMGPTAGAYRIEIHWNKKTGKQIPNPMDRESMTDELIEGLPDKYHKESELTADVSAEKTKFDFDLKTK
jgi:hypothetical protein